MVTSKLLRPFFAHVRVLAAFSPTALSMGQDHRVLMHYCWGSWLVGEDNANVILAPLAGSLKSKSLGIILPVTIIGVPASAVAPRITARRTLNGYGKATNISTARIRFPGYEIKHSAEIDPGEVRIGVREISHDVSISRSIQCDDRDNNAGHRTYRQE